MLKKTRGIVLKNTKYSETSVISKIYTEEFGLISYLVNGVRSKSAKIKPSHLQPLNLLELEVYSQQNKNLQRIKELQCTPTLHNLPYDVVKSSVGMFMLEVVGKSVVEEETNKTLFNFLFNSIQILDLETESISNFPHYFLVQFSKYMGFYPKDDYSEATPFFNLNSGEFTAHESEFAFMLKPPFSQYLHQLRDSNFNNLNTVKVPAAQRAELLRELVHYFEIHALTPGKIGSHKILADVLKD